MADNFFKVKNGLNLGTQATAPLTASQGDLYTDSVTNKVMVYLNGAWHEVVSNDGTHTLTNKTIVAADNTITTAASGNLTSTSLNAALSELQTDVDSRATATSLTTHANTSTGVHGVTGAVVGTTDTQTLTNKTINAASNTISNIANANISATAAIVDTKLATISTAGKVANSATSAVSGNTANTIVLRGNSGEFSAGVITASDLFVSDKNIMLNNGGTDATSEGAGLVIDRVGTDGILIYKDASATKFAAGASGSEVDLVGTTSTQTLTNKTISAASNTITTAASGNLTSTTLNAALAELQADIDSRQSSGSYISALTGDVTATGPGSAAATVAAVGGKTSSAVAQSVTDTTNATNLNTANMLVKRGAAGEIAAGAITAASLSVTGDLTVSGTTTTINTTNLNVKDANIIVNNGGTDVSSEGAGLTVDRVGTDGSLIYRDASATKFAAGALAAEVDLVGTTSTQTLTNKTIVAANNTITTAASGNLAATSLNAALAELQSDIDTRVTSSTLTAHTGASSGVHGVTGSVVGTSDTQILTNKTIDASSNTISNIVNANISATAAIADSKLATISTAGKVLNSATTATNANTASAIVARDASGNFSAGTITATLSGNATNVTGTVAIANGGTGQTTKAAAFNALHPMTTTGDMIYSSSGTTSSRLAVGSSGQVLKSVGGVPTWATFSGGINYLSSNPDAEADTSGWTTYADAAGTAPVDGTGGTAQANLWTRSATNPLRGTASFVLDKTGTASRQGQGVAYDFTIDRADQAKVLSVSFDYEVSAGTYADGDVTVYLIADPAGTPVVIQPAGYTIQSVASGVENKHIATFQTSASATSYRLVLHIASASTQNYTLAFDNFQVGPQTVQYGAPVTDWVDYTPTISVSSGSVPTFSSKIGKWRRVGDSIEVQATITWSAAATFSGLYVSLPTGAIDTNKSSGTTREVGIAYIKDVGTANYFGVVREVTNLYTDRVEVQYPNTSISPVTQAIPFTFGSGDDISVSFTVPIVGWSSTVQMSDDTDTRVVAADIFNGSGAAQAISANTDTKIAFNTVRQDTHGAFNTSTYRYVVPVSGWYQFSGRVILTAMAAAAQVSLYLSVNGGKSKVSSQSVPAGVNTGASFGFLSYINAGQYVEFSIFSSQATTISTAAADYGGSCLSINRLSGPSAIAASETVASSIYPTSNITLTDAVADLTSFTKEFDTHGSWNTTTGVYTFPTSGIYELAANFSSLDTGATASAGIIFSTVGTGSAPSKTIVYNEDLVASKRYSFSPKILFQANAGDTIKLRGRSVTNTSTLLGGSVNTITIRRIS